MTVATCRRPGRPAAHDPRAGKRASIPAAAPRQRRVLGRFAAIPLDTLPEPLPDPAPQRGGRRRSPLDDTERLAGFLDLLRLGQWRGPAARSVGWSEDSVEGWLRRGRGVAGPDRPPTARYVAFARAVDQAEAEAEVNLVAIVSAAARTNGRVAMWFLERRWPERWGRWRCDQPPDESRSVPANMGYITLPAGTEPLPLERTDRPSGR